MLEERGWEIDPGDFEFFGELGTNSGGRKATQYAATRRDAPLLKQEDILHAHDVLIHAGDFCKVRDTPRSVAHARDLNDDADCCRNLLADGFLKNILIKADLLN